MRIILAPMEGLADVHLRRLITAQGGFDWTVSEFVRVVDRLYPDIDLAETLSCVTGKWIKRITADEVEFTDGSKQSLSKPDWRLLKPLIFWGPIV